MAKQKRREKEAPVEEAPTEVAPVEVVTKKEAPVDTRCYYRCLRDVQVSMPRPRLIKRDTVIWTQNPLPAHYLGPVAKFRALNVAERQNHQVMSDAVPCPDLV